MKKRLLMWGLATVVTSVLLICGLFVFYPPSPFPKDIRSNTTTPLYYPTKLPPKFTINQNSFSEKNGVVLYSFDTPDGNKLNVTVEKAPKNYNFDDLYGTTMEDTKTVATPLGSAHIGTLGENTMASLVTGGTWILAVYSQSGASDDLASIMKSFKLY